MPPPPEGEGPPGEGDGRIDAAVDHFVALGFAARDVRSAVEALLQEHGGAAAGWPFLEEGSYRAVQGRLLEKEEEEVMLLLEAEGEPQQLEAAAVNEESPEHGMQISQVYSEQAPQTNSVPEKSKLLASPNKSPVHEAVLPFSTVSGTDRLKPPTHGWISTESESKSESEGESDNGEILSSVPNSAESLLSKRKRPSRWDDHERTKW